MIRTVLPVLVLLLAVPAPGFSQFGIGSHTVTIQVASLSVLQVSSGTVNLNISGADAVAGQDQMTVSDQTTSLLWGTNSGSQKITASTSLLSQLFMLKLLALNPTTGMAAGEVTLTITPADLLLGVGRSSGSCLLRYSGIALASQGTGSDAHTITFTIQTQ